MTAARLLWEKPAVVVDLLGASVAVAYELDAVVHEARVASGVAPVVDPGLLHCLLLNGQIAAAPLRIVGVAAAGGSWGSASRRAAGLSAFGPVAGVIPARRCHRLTLLDAAATGLGLVVVGGGDGGNCQALVPPGPWDAPTPTGVVRLVQEQVYAAVWGRARVPVA